MLSSPLARLRQCNSSTPQILCNILTLSKSYRRKDRQKPKGQTRQECSGNITPGSSLKPLPCSASGRGRPWQLLCTWAESGSFLLLTNREQQYLLNMSSFSALLCILPLLSRDKSIQTIIRIPFVPNTNTFLLFLALTVTDFFSPCVFNFLYPFSALDNF